MADYLNQYAVLAWDDTAPAGQEYSAYKPLSVLHTDTDVASDAATASSIAADLVKLGLIGQKAAVNEIPSQAKPALQVKPAQPPAQPRQ
mgnify:CR=1